jgi:desulfoferrodoxin-like iron-binding protein
MTEIDQVYKCDICGNTVKVITAGAGDLVCCGQPMKLRAGEAESVQVPAAQPGVQPTQPASVEPAPQAVEPASTEPVIPPTTEAPEPQTEEEPEQPAS